MDFEETRREDVGSIIRLGYVTVPGSCEHGNEPWVSVKYGGYLH